MVIVRPASEADLPALLAGAREFVAESAYGWTFVEELAADTFRRYIGSDGGAVLVADDGDGAIAGAAIVVNDRDFCAERLGFVVKFYLRPMFRGATAGRSLALACCEWFQANLCWAAFVTATANVSADRLFVNLFKKFGFVELGPTMIKDFGGTR